MAFFLCHWWLNALYLKFGSEMKICREPTQRKQWHPTPLPLPGKSHGRRSLVGFTFTFHFHALEKEMATHASALAWRIPGKVEPGGVRSMGSHRVGHDWSDLAAAAAELLYNVALVSAVQQSESATSIYMSPPSWTSLPSAPSHPSRSPQSTEVSALGRR